MLNAKDLELLASKGITPEALEEQLACFAKGFPFLEIEASASVEKGIKVISQDEQATYMEAWDKYLAQNKKILKFVPASYLMLVNLPSQIKAASAQIIPQIT